MTVEPSEAAAVGHHHLVAAPDADDGGGTDAAAFREAERVSSGQGFCSVMLNFVHSSVYRRARMAILFAARGWRSYLHRNHAQIPIRSTTAAFVVERVGPARREMAGGEHEHFTVLTNSSEKDARHVASQFERMRAVFHVLMPAASDDPAAPIVVLALKDKKSFRTLEPAAYLAKDQLDLAGLFVRAQDRNYVLVRLDAEGEHPFSTVYHEYTHYMFRKYEELMPLWLNEGLAEFYRIRSCRIKTCGTGQQAPTTFCTCARTG